MKIFRKFLVSVMSFGMICSSTFAINPSFERLNGEWDDEVFRVIASHTPRNLDECCLALDDALHDKEEIKEEIKHSSDYFNTSYLRYISNTHRRVGGRIAYYWLYLPEPSEVGESGRRRPSPLADLFYAHSADFSDESPDVMVHIIFDNYRYYLNNGKSNECSIEDMAIDYWFNFWRFFDSNYKREKLESMMAKWPEVKAAHCNSFFDCIFEAIGAVGRVFGCCLPHYRG